MYGSRAYVESLSEKERENIILMINIDTVLAGDYLYLYGGKVNDNGTVDNTCLLYTSSFFLITIF